MQADDAAFLKSVGDIAASDQQAAAVVRFADVVSKFYASLIAQGISEDAARELSCALIYATLENNGRRSV